MNKYYLCIVLGLFTMLVTGCGGIDKYNPFSESKPVQAYKPENSIEYQCDNNKRFYLRMQDKVNAVWLIYPSREVSLEKVTGGTGTRYSNGIAVLDINGAEATLNDGPAIAYTGCKTATQQK